jgi:hypothetical protein
MTVSPIASADRTGATLMLAKPAPAHVNIEPLNLAVVFKSRRITYAEYLVDPYTSNYAYDRRGKGALARIAHGAAPARSSFAASVTLNANSVLLIVLQPRSPGRAMAGAVQLRGQSQNVKRNRPATARRDVRQNRRLPRSGGVSNTRCAPETNIVFSSRAGA